MTSEEKRLRLNAASRRYNARHPDRIQARNKQRRENGSAAAYSRKRRQEFRAEINKIKAITPCKDCGKNFPPECMDLDHLGEKKKAVSHMVSDGYSREALSKEVSKCEVVCANCHRIRTEKRKQKNLTWPVTGSNLQQ
jgi:L-lysine 2,3-aminomutase